MGSALDTKRCKRQIFGKVELHSRRLEGGGGTLYPTVECVNRGANPAVAFPRTTGGSSNAHIDAGPPENRSKKRAWPRRVSLLQHPNRLSPRKQSGERGREVCPPQRTLPGLRIPFGSSVVLSILINASSSGLREKARYFFFFVPMPCSAEIVPPYC